METLTSGMPPSAIISFREIGGYSWHVVNSQEVDQSPPRLIHMLQTKRANNCRLFAQAGTNTGIAVRSDEKDVLWASAVNALLKPFIIILPLLIWCCTDRSICWDQKDPNIFIVFVLSHQPGSYHSSTKVFMELTAAKFPAINSSTTQYNSNTLRSTFASELLWFQTSA